MEFDISKIIKKHEYYYYLPIKEQMKTKDNYTFNL